MSDLQSRGYGFDAGNSKLYNESGQVGHTHLGGVMALFVECRTRDQEVVGLSRGWAHGVETLGKFSHVCASVHQAV